MNNPAKTNIFNLANLITIARIFMTIPLVLSLHNLSSSPTKSNALEVLFILVLIVLSDVLDGYVARKMNMISNFGKLLDPISDKICLMVVIIFLVFQGNVEVQDKVQGLAILLFFILLSIRDVYIIIIGLNLQKGLSYGTKS